MEIGQYGPGEVQKLVLVSPQHRLVLLHVHARHDIVQVDDDILCVVSNDGNEASLLLLDAISNERRNARVSAIWVRQHAIEHPTAGIHTLPCEPWLRRNLRFNCLSEEVENGERLLIDEPCDKAVLENFFGRDGLALILLGASALYPRFRHFRTSQRISARLLAASQRRLINSRSYGTTA